eukprot:m51a1_g7978 hypothetical protein (190) ;mRNA; r:47556-48218
MLHCGQVRLRALEKSDAVLFHAWLNERETVRNLDLASPMSMASEEAFVASHCNSAHPSHTEIAYAVDARDQASPSGWALVGNVGLMSIDWLHRNAVLGVFIGDKERRGKGLGHDAIVCMLRHAFDDLGLHRVSLNVVERNAAAVRCYEKVGFTLEGRSRQARWKDGRWFDNLCMAILADEFWQKHGHSP